MYNHEATTWERDRPIRALRFLRTLAGSLRGGSWLCPRKEYISFQGSSMLLGVKRRPRAKQIPILGRKKNAQADLALEVCGIRHKSPIQREKGITLEDEGILKK
jgi:hypothetical protein